MMEGVSESSGSEGTYDSDTGRAASAGVEGIIAAACLQERGVSGRDLSQRAIEVIIYDARIADAENRRDAALVGTVVAVGAAAMSAKGGNVKGAAVEGAGAAIGCGVITKRQFELDVLRREQQMVKEGRDPHAPYTPPELTREYYERGGPYDCPPPVFYDDSGNREGGCICKIDD